MINNNNSCLLKMYFKVSVNTFLKYLHLFEYFLKVFLHLLCNYCKRSILGILKIQRKHYKNDCRII